MAFSQESQGFSMGYTVGSQGSSPQKKTRQEDKFSCLPVTIRSIEEGLKNSDENSVRIHGEEAGMLLVVGMVESLVKQAASYEFMLNDSTGRIKARLYFTTMTPDLERIEAGKYVSLVGGVRTKPMQHLGVQCMSLVDSPDAISFHMLEACHAALKLQRTAADPSTPLTKRPIASPQAATREFGGPDVMTPPKGVKSEIETNPVQMQVEAPTKIHIGNASLHETVLQFLQAAAGDAEGVLLSAIAAKVEPAPLSDVKACLAKLVDDGEVYNTIDDDHFATV